MSITFLPPEHTGLAFIAALRAWQASLKRPDLSEEDRVKGALLAYQRQLDACAIRDQLDQRERAECEADEREA